MNAFLKPFKDSFLIKILAVIAFFLYSFFTNAQINKNSELFKTLKSKDSIIFERAFNKCELKKLNPIIADNFEFYHDVAGIQNKEQFMNSIKNNICTNPGYLKRELVKNSIEVFALNNNGKLYGAIQKGKHTFLENNNFNEKIVGIANFTHLWILENKQWKLKRVLSYNHLPYSK